MIGQTAMYQLWGGRVEVRLFGRPGNWSLYNLERQCEVPLDQAFWISSADCPTLIAYSPVSGMVVVAHAGLKSLLDRQQDGHKSVVSAVVNEFAEAEQGQLRAFITCGIGPENFTHDKDPKLIDYLIERWGRRCVVGNSREGKIALTELIGIQLEDYNIPSYNIGHDTTDTYSDKDANGKYLWWSHRRANDNKEEDPNARNGVLIIRRW